MAMKNDGVVPYYPHMYNGCMNDMNCEMKMMSTQPRTPIKEYISDVLDIMFHHGVSYKDSNMIKAHKCHTTIGNLPLLKKIHNRNS